MKKTLLLMASILIVHLGYSQEGIEENGAAQLGLGINYFTGGSIDYEQGSLKVMGSAEYDMSVQGQVSDNRYVGIEYAFVPTSTQFTASSELYNNDTANLNIHFFNFFVTQYYGSGNIQPFTDFGLGAAFYIPSTNYDTKSYFDFSFKVGANFPISESVGFKLGVGMRMPFLRGNAGNYCGIGGYSGANCGLTLNSTSVLPQFNVGGSFVFNM